MQDGVLHTADVLIDGKPVLRDRGLEWRRRVLRVRVAIEVPARIDERVHGVGFASRRLAALRAGHVYKFRHVRQRRSALDRDVHLVRQNHRKLLIGHGHNAIALAMNYRNGRAPVALAADPPVAQAERDRGFTEAFARGNFLKFLLGVGACQSVVLPGIHEHAVFGNER